MDAKLRRQYARTGPSMVGDGVILVRGHDIRRVIKDLSFEESLYYQVHGRIPDEKTKGEIRQALVSNTKIELKQGRSLSESITHIIFELESRDLPLKGLLPEGLEILLPLLHNIPRAASAIKEEGGRKKEKGRAALSEGSGVSDGLTGGDVCASYEQYIFQTILGRMPSVYEERLMTAYLVSLCEHGETSPSTPGALIVSNLRGSFQQAAISFVLAADTPFHFGALPRAVAQLEELHGENMHDFIEDKLSKSYPDNVIYGFGHRYHKTSNFVKLSDEEKNIRAESIDPRVATLSEIASELGFRQGKLQFVREMGHELWERKGIPINIDGIAAGILLDAGFSAETALAFVYMGRLPMIARKHIEQLDVRPNTLWAAANDRRTTTLDFSTIQNNNIHIKDYKTKGLPEDSRKASEADLERGLGDDSYAG